MTMQKPGQIALFGSGETSPMGGQIFEALARDLPESPSISILETPAGFELNSAQVAGRVAEFIKVRLQNYQPQVTLIPARKKGRPDSPDEPGVVEPMLTSDLIFLGPGSPTYAVRQLHDSLAWYALAALQRTGVTLALASAATIAFGKLALPIYEIYKVGEDPHWKPGLDLLGPYGLPVVLVPHWNNSEGGAELDTSRCFIGQKRFELLASMLDEDTIILGIDEHTGLILDFATGSARVLGRDQVHIVRGGREQSFTSGQSFFMDELGRYRLPETDEGIPSRAWQWIQTRRNELIEAKNAPVPIPEEVQELVSQRQDARANQAWADADKLRRQINALGWQVMDTPDGPQIEPTRQD